MQHLAKNVVMVNRGLSKHMVSQSVVLQGVGESGSHSDLMPACKFIAYFFKELIFNWIIDSYVFLFTLINFCTFLFQTIKNKYATSKHAKISTLAQLNSALVQDLAKAVAKV